MGRARLDLRDWVPADHLAHFVIDAVESLDLRAVRLNTRGTGDAQYPPTMKDGTGFELVCLAYNVRRLHTLARQQMPVAIG